VKGGSGTQANDEEFPCPLKVVEENEQVFVHDEHAKHVPRPKDWKTLPDSAKKIGIKK